MTVRLQHGNKLVNNLKTISEVTAGDLFIGLRYLFETRNHGGRELIK